MTLHGHTSGGVWSVAFRPQEGILASGSDDGTIRFWNTATGECLRALRDDKPYEKMNITGITGVTEAQRIALLVLGAIEES